MLSKEELVKQIREGMAEKLYLWLHNSGAPSFDSKKTPEVVRVAHRKRAGELLSDLASQGLCLEVEGELPVTDELISWSDVRKAGYGKFVRLKDVLKEVNNA